MPLDFDDYQNRTEDTNIYSGAIDDLLFPIEKAIATNGDDGISFLGMRSLHQVREILNYYYTVLGLVGEAGELANDAKRVIRDKGKIDGEEVGKELGDVCWYVSQVAATRNMNLSDIVNGNLKKLASRKNRDVLGGSGNDR